MLTILTGPPGCGKTSRLLEQLKTVAQKGERGLLLVPESASHQAERRLLEVCGNRASRYVSVTTFSKLVEDVLRESGCRASVLDAGGRVLTMHLALSRVQSSLTYYRKAPRPPLVEKLVEVSAELMACGISPARLLEAGAVSPKIGDLGLIYASYHDLCQKGSLDPAARIDLAARQLVQSGLTQGAHLFIDGFEGFTYQKFAFLEQLMACCASVTAALTVGRDLTLYREPMQTAERLCRMAEKQGVAHKTVPCPPSARAWPRGTEGLAEELFDFRAEAGEGADGLHLYTLTDPAAECELAAALLRQRALSGLRCREMAVVCGDLEAYGPMLQTAFAKYGLPLYLSQKSDLLQKPALQAALGGLAALEDGLSAQSVTGWLRQGVGALPRDAVDRLENYCFQWNIKGGKWLAPFTSPTCGYGTPTADEEQLLAAVEQTRLRAAALLSPLREGMKACRLGADFARCMTAHLEHICLEALLQERCEALRQSGHGREAAETAQLYQILLNALEQFEGVMADTEMDRREFFRLLQLTLRQYEVSAIPPSLDSVQAVSFERLPGTPVREMVIVGGREGLFPPEKDSQSLLSEQERTALELEGIELTQNALERAWQQQCALCRALAAPLEGLTVTAPRHLADGTAALPGFAFTRLGQLRRVAPADGDALLEALRLTAPKPLFALACGAAEDGGSGPAKAALEEMRRQPEARDYLDRLRRYALSPRGPIGDPELVKALYGGRISLTATRLERVSTCRMSHFLQYGLKAKARRQARFGAPEIGTFLHYVVEHSIPDLCRDETLLPEALAAKYVNEYLERYMPKGQLEARHRALFRQAGLMACRVVKNVWEEIRAGDFRPVCFELDFSKKGDLPPLELREGSMTLTVGGKVDRVDGYVRGDTLYLKVVDYKTGTKQFRLSDLLYGLNLQMFLYLMMLTSADPEKVISVCGKRAARVVPCGALYIPAKDPFVPVSPEDTPETAQQELDKALRRIGLVLDDDDLIETMERGGTYRFLPVSRRKQGGFTAASCVATAAQMGRLLRKTEDTLRHLARQIAEGDIEATPYRTGLEDTPCRYCDFREACHFDTGMKKDKLRFLPAETPARVHQILEAEQEGREEQA